MICCKIIGNYNSMENNFSELLSELCDVGQIIWENNSLFFSNIDDSSINEEYVERLIKKYFGNKYYIENYSFENFSKENEYIDHWVYDKLIKINYKKCEQESQKAFHEISKGLDMIDNEVARLKEEIKDEEASLNGEKE